METLIAIDVALIPSASLYNAAVALSRQTGDRHYVLGTVKIPHITLVQGLLPITDLPLAQAKLKEIASAFPSGIQLNATACGTRAEGTSVWLYLDNIDALQEAHQRAWAAFSPILSFDNAKDEHFVDDGTSTGWERESEWLSGFPVNACLANFNPHITLGKGVPPAFTGITATTNRLSLYQMGPGCSCVKEWFACPLPFNA